MDELLELKAIVDRLRASLWLVMRAFPDAEHPRPAERLAAGTPAGAANGSPIGHAAVADELGELQRLEFLANRAISRHGS